MKETVILSEGAEEVSVDKLLEVDSQATSAIAAPADSNRIEIFFLNMVFLPPTYAFKYNQFSIGKMAVNDKM